MNNPSYLSKALLIKIFNDTPIEPISVHRDIILQILNVQIHDQLTQNPAKSPGLLVSDGVYFSKAMLVNDAKKKLSTLDPKANDIISCNIVLHKSQVFCIMDMIIIRDDIRQPIGNPKDLVQGSRNLEERSINVMIPARVSNQNPLKNITAARENLPQAPIFKNQRQSYDIDEPSESRENVGQYDEISMLTIYKTDFVIKGRVISKDQMRKFTNQKGEGHVFSFTVMDDSKAPKNIVKCTFFNEMAVQYFDLIQLQNVYTFSGGDIKPKNPRFNTTKHDCEVTFNRNTQISSMADSSKIPKQKDNFELLSCIEKYEKYHEIDIMVLVKSVSECEQINLKAGGVKNKRVIKVFDESGWLVDLTLWGEDITGTA